MLIVFLIESLAHTCSHMLKGWCVQTVEHILLSEEHQTGMDHVSRFSINVTLTCCVLPGTMMLESVILLCSSVNIKLPNGNTC